MAKWSEKFLNWIRGWFKGPESISNKIKLELKINSQNKITNIDNLTVIQVGDSNEIKDILTNIIIEQVKADIPLLDSVAQKDVEETSKAVELNLYDQELLNYYKDKLPLSLYELLHLCLILRNMRVNHLDTSGFKKRIMKEYPIHGRNMTNLVNEKYFEYKFKDLYAEMAQEEGFEITKYHDEINYQIRKLPSMIFIDQKQDYTVLLGDARWKLLQMIEHGLEDITLHAIGYNNVEIAKKILDDLSKENPGFKELIDGAFVILKPTYYKAVIRKCS